MNGGTPVWKSRGIITDKLLSCDLLIMKEDVGTKNIQEVLKKEPNFDYSPLCLSAVVPWHLAQAPHLWCQPARLPYARHNWDL